LRLEAEVHVRAQKELQRLQEARVRIAEEHQRLEESRLRADEAEQRLSRLELSRKKAEAEAQERATKEDKLRADIDGFAAQQQGQTKFVTVGPIEPQGQAVAETAPVSTKETVSFPATGVGAKKVGSLNGSERVARRAKRSERKENSAASRQG
ncbi:MAG: hypothetical protein M3R68_05100, partial [Acidobacteriota bacterium]|nr:hypothetical protein [Acidobacteriota bacterium]